MPTDPPKPSDPHPWWVVARSLPLGIFLLICWAFISAVNLALVVGGSAHVLQWVSFVVAGILALCYVPSIVFLARERSSAPRGPVAVAQSGDRLEAHPSTEER